MYRSQTAIYRDCETRPDDPLLDVTCSAIIQTGTGPLIAMFYTVLSYLLLPLFWLLAICSRRRPIRRILVIQTAKIGDMICATPLFREIKRAHPQATLAVMHDPLTRPILEFNPHVDTMIPCQQGDFKTLRGKIRLARLLRRGQYDVALIMNPNVSFIVGTLWAGIPCRLAVYPDFSGRTFRLAAPLLSRTVLHRPDRLLIDAYFQLLASLGIKATDSRREVYAAPAAHDRVAGLLGGTSHLIGIAVSSGNKLKALGTDKLEAIIDLLHSVGSYTIVLIGTEADKEESSSIRSQVKMPDRVIDTCGMLKLNELPALLEKLSLFIGVDSGVTYMADAFSIPIVLIAGPVNSTEQRPTNSPQIILKRNLPCAPCAHVFRAPNQCATGTRECINGVSAEEIVQAARQLLPSAQFR